MIEERKNGDNGNGPEDGGPQRHLTACGSGNSDRHRKKSRREADRVDHHKEGNRRGDEIFKRHQIPPDMIRFLFRRRCVVCRYGPLPDLRGAQVQATDIFNPNSRRRGPVRVAFAGRTRYLKV